MISSVTPDSHCQSCGAPLDPMVLGGGCPACLWAGLIGEEKEEQKTLADAPEVEGYEILEEIGQGGMGVVYRARQEVPAREVALKMVAPFSLRAAQARERFLVEVEAMAAVEHPALLPLYDAGEDRHGRPWLTMLLAQGGTLADRVSSFQGDWRKTAQLMIRLCEAMQYAHERGILHRDLKPANILFDREDHAYIADFGLAKWADDDSGITKASSMLGSPAYLAPEAAREGSKMTTTVSDVYGLGAVLYELLVGAKPYEGEQVAEVLTQILDGSPPAPRKRLRNIPRDLEVIVLKAMAREPEKRYHSAAAFAEDLELWMEGRAIRARPVGMLERGLIWARRNPAVATLSFLFLTSLVTGGALLWKSNQRLVTSEALLWESNQKLTASLDDVEARVEFMTRELPALLKPVGRMEPLDDVFLNLSEYYENNERDDPESLARYADFLTQWSQILRDRGQADEMIQRLRLALEKAKEAVKGGKPTVAVARARVAAGWRLGEVLIFSGESWDSIDPEKLNRAREVLTETADFAEGLEFEDLRYRVLVAQLKTELMILKTDEKQGEQAVEYGMMAKEAWDEVLPQLKADMESAHSQLALISATDVHYFREKAYRLNGETRSEELALKEWVRTRGELAASDPRNLLFRHRYAVARRAEVERGKVDAVQAAKILREVDEDFLFLLMRDSANVRWRTEAVTIARMIAQNAQKQGNAEEHMRWMHIVAERLVPLYKMEATNYLKLLKHRRHDAALCGLAFLESDWKKAFLHLNGSARTQVRIVKISGDQEEWDRLEGMKKRMKFEIEKRDGKEAAKEWEKNLQLN